jgi:hypothetical protein
MLLNLLPGLRELRAPLAAGYIWLFAAWLAFNGDIPEPAGAANFFDQFEALGAAAALTFAAYLIGSFLSDLFGFVWYAIRLVRIGPISGSPESYPVGMLGDNRLRERLIRIQASEPLSPEGAAALDEVAKRTVRRIPPERRGDVDRRVFRDADYRVRGPGGPRWLLGRRTAYEPWKLKVGDSADDEQTLALHVVAALGDELDTARFRLLSEEKDLFHEVDRLSAEGEFRLAVTPPLTAVVAVLAATASLLWLLALLPLGVLVMLGLMRQEQSGDRIVYAIRAAKIRTPTLEQLDAEVTKNAETAAPAEAAT